MKSGKLNESENKNADSSRLGAWIFVHLFTFRAIPDAQRKNKQYKRKETPFFMPLISENIGFLAQAGKPKTVYRVGTCIKHFHYDERKQIFRGYVPQEGV